VSHTPVEMGPARRKHKRPYRSRAAGVSYHSRTAGRRAGPAWLRPETPEEVALTQEEVSRANPLWGAPRIHSELPKLRLTVSQATVSKYMLRRRRPPSQAWRTFYSRRRLVHFDVTEHPTAEWTARPHSTIPRATFPPRSGSHAPACSP
jgi:hypothetical protein